MQSGLKNFSFLKNSTAIILFGLFFSFFIVFLNYEKIQNHFSGPSFPEIQHLDSLTVQARDLTRLDPNKSLALTFKVFEKSQELNYKKGLGNSYRLLSIASVQARNFVLTREYIEKAREIFQELGDESGMADVENSEGNLFIYMNDTVNAIRPYKKAFEIYSKLKRNDRVRVAAYNLAYSYSAFPNIDSTKYFLKISEDLKKEKSEIPGFAVTQGLRGKIAYMEGDYDQAELYFKESLDYYNANKFQESFVAYFESTLFLAKIFKSNDKIDEAIALLNESAGSEAIFLGESLSRQVYIDLIQIYESKGDYLNSTRTFWEKEKFEAELDRRRVEQAKNFSAELALYRGFQLENEALNSRLSTVTFLSVFGGVFTFVILLLFLRVIFLNRKNKELNILIDKSFQIAQIGTFELGIQADGKLELIENSDIIVNLLAINSPSAIEKQVTLDKLFDEAQREKLTSIIQKYVGVDEFFKEEFNLSNLSGERKIIRVIAKVAAGKEDEVFLKGILLDITSEYQLLEQTRENLDKEKNLKELREQLMHMTSHELRTPLSNISSSVELISLLNSKITQEDLQFRFKNIVQNARSNITRLVSMLDDLLLYERVQSGEFEFLQESFDLKPYLESLINEVQEAKNSEAIVLLMMTDEGLIIESDKVLLHHIFTNLLGNSIKYLDKKLPVELEVIDTQKEVRFRIKDYGIGIPEKDLERLFTPFKRASNVGGKPGTGLGLSIVKRMVTMLGGNINVISKEGEFSEFSVILPKMEKK